MSPWPVQSFVPTVNQLQGVTPVLPYRTLPALGEGWCFTEVSIIKFDILPTEYCKIIRILLFEYVTGCVNHQNMKPAQSCSDNEYNRQLKKDMKRKVLHASPQKVIHRLHLGFWLLFVFMVWLRYFLSICYIGSDLVVFSRMHSWWQQQRPIA